MNARFAIGAVDGPRSAVWNVWRHTNPRKADVFLAARALASAMKISFHQSGEVRDAFNHDFQIQRRRQGNEPGRRERLVWRRGSYDDSGIVRLYQVCVPHSELREWPLDNDLAQEDVFWIPAVKERDATFVEFVLTRPGLEHLELRNFEAATNAPVVHWFLPTGENFLVLPRSGDLDSDAVRKIQDAAATIAASSVQIPPSNASTRLNLIMEPTDAVGVVVETAWPCTVSSRPDPRMHD